MHTGVPHGGFWTVYTGRPVWPNSWPSLLRMENHRWHDNSNTHVIRGRKGVKQLDKRFSPKFGSFPKFNTKISILFICSGLSSGSNSVNVNTIVSPSKSPACKKTRTEKASASRHAKSPTSKKPRKVTAVQRGGNIFYSCTVCSKTSASIGRPPNVKLLYVFAWESIQIKYMHWLLNFLQADEKERERGGVKFLHKMQ